jgi:hypothetical protein
MKITVRIGEVEVIIDRPGFNEGEGVERRKNIMEDTLMPMLTETINKAKELFNEKRKTDII